MSSNLVGTREEIRLTEKGGSDQAAIYNGGRDQRTCRSTFERLERADTETCSESWKRE